MRHVLRERLPVGDGRDAVVCPAARGPVLNRGALANAESEWYLNDGGAGIKLRMGAGLRKDTHLRIRFRMIYSSAPNTLQTTVIAMSVWPCSSPSSWRACANISTDTAKSKEPPPNAMSNPMSCSDALGMKGAILTSAPNGSEAALIRPHVKATIGAHVIAAG